MLLWIIGFSILGSIGAVAGAAVLLIFPEAIRKVLVPRLISYATGTLLGAAFLGMIPAGLSQAPAVALMAWYCQLVGGMPKLAPVKDQQYDHPAFWT